MPKFFILFSMLLLAACSTTIREVQPTTTATQQYLIAQSAINASNQITVKDPSSLGKVFIDTSNFDGTKYTIAEIQEVLLKDGVAITDDKTKADTIISIRLGVQSVDNRVVNMGMPSIPIPLPVPLVTLSTPEITLLQKDQSIGITMIGLTAYNVKTGLLVQDLGEKLGLSFNTIWSSVAGTEEHNDFDHSTVPAKK